MYFSTWVYLAFWVYFSCGMCLKKNFSAKCTFLHGCAWPFACTFRVACAFAKSKPAKGELWTKSCGEGLFLTPFLWTQKPIGRRLFIFWAKSSPSDSLIFGKIKMPKIKLSKGELFGQKMKSLLSMGVIKNVKKRSFLKKNADLYRDYFFFMEKKRDFCRVNQKKQKKTSPWITIDFFTYV